MTCERIVVAEDGMFEEGNTTEVDIEVCMTNSKEAQPKEMATCNDNIPCPVRYRASEFGSVSNTFFGYVSCPV